MNIYKYKLDFSQTQTVFCRAIKILDIQIQDGRPVMWTVEKTDIEEKEINIIMQPTGTGVALVENLAYVSTTQTNGFVWHWFTDIDSEEQS